LGRAHDLPRPVRAMSNMRRSYVRVLVIWIVVLAALYAFQEYFS
jgi:hypothetical protein